MSTVESIASSILSELLKETLTERLQGLVSSNESVTSKMQKINNQNLAMPTVTNLSSLQDLLDGKYDVSIKDYTNLSTYNLLMSNLYGNSSADKFKSYLTNLYGEDNGLATAKTFVEKMKENGLSGKAAVKMFSALQSYSLASSLNNYSCVSAKI